MTTPTLQLLPLILCVLYVTGSTAETNLAEDFVKSACGGTRYPMVCLGALSGHASAIQLDWHQLAQTALTVGLAAAESTKKNMLKLTNIKGLQPKEYGAMKDCLDQVDECVDRLSQSLREIDQMGLVRGEEFLWHKSNIETWTSAALSQVETCAEAFSDSSLDGKIKASVQGQVMSVEQTISVGLGLFRMFTEFNTTTTGDF